MVGADTTRAGSATRAVLSTRGQRITENEAEDVTAQLPENEGYGDLLADVDEADT